MENQMAAGAAERQDGWYGGKYDSSFSCKQIVEKVRTEIKEKFSSCKFSVRMPRYGSIAIALMQAPFEAFINPNEHTHEQVNQYHLDKDEVLTPEAIQTMKGVYEIAMAYNHDRSDSMTDYFDVKFYLDLEVGKYDKPFVVVEK